MLLDLSTCLMMISELWKLYWTNQSQCGGLLVEPIQGEAGVFTPAGDFIKRRPKPCVTNTMCCS